MWHRTASVSNLSFTLERMLRHQVNDPVRKTTKKPTTHCCVGEWGPCPTHIGGSVATIPPAHTTSTITAKEINLSNPPIAATTTTTIATTTSNPQRQIIFARNPRLYWHDEAVKIHPVADLEVSLLEGLGGLLFGEGDELRKQRLAILCSRTKTQDQDQHQHPRSTSKP